MAVKNRLERLEQEARFRDWLQLQRLLDVVSIEQLEFFASFGYWMDPPPSEPAPGVSQIDRLSRHELTKMFESDERKMMAFVHRSDTDKEFFCVHGHWPQTLCEVSECRKPLMDELLRKHRSNLAQTGGVNAT